MNKSQKYPVHGRGICHKYLGSRVTLIDRLLVSFHNNLHLPSAVFTTQVLVGPSKQLKQIFQIEHNTVKNRNWSEANKLAIYKRGRGFELGATGPGIQASFLKYSAKQQTFHPLYNLLTE